MSALRTPNALSVASLALGLLALAALARTDIAGSGRWLALALLMDGLAGLLAARPKGKSALGVELDSLSALLSFGVASPALVYQAKLHVLGPLGMALTGALAVSAGLHLARRGAFDLNRRYGGLPVQVSGLTLVWVALLGLSPTLLSFLILIFIVLNLSPLGYARLPRDLGWRAPLGAVLIAAALGWGVAIWILVVIGLAYAGTAWIPRTTSR